MSGKPSSNPTSTSKPPMGKPAITAPANKPAAKPATTQPATKPMPGTNKPKTGK